MTGMPRGDLRNSPYLDRPLRSESEVMRERKRRKAAKRGGTILDLISWTLIITLLGAACVIAAKAGQDKQDSINQQQSGWEK